jgi:hypothetical protein
MVSSADPPATPMVSTADTPTVSIPVVSSVSRTPAVSTDPHTYSRLHPTSQPTDTESEGNMLTKLICD